MPSVRIRIGGRVQGVYFRATAQLQAATLHVNGFIRNEPDGSIYLEAEATQAILDQFISWCRLGPPRATVTTFVMENQPEIGYVGFEIRR